MRFKYLLYVLAPILLGFIYSFSSYIDILNIVFSVVVPIAFIFLWVFVGMQFADLTDNPFLAVLLSHLTLILGLVFHYFKLDKSQNPIINVLNFFIGKAILCISPLVSKIAALLKISNPDSKVIYVSLGIALLFFIAGYAYNYQKFVRSRYQFHKNLFR